MADVDPIETQEWLDALHSVIREEGLDRAKYILEQIQQAASAAGVSLPSGIYTAYKNTIATEAEKPIPPDDGVVKRIMAIIRWNAVAMVLRATKKAPELGGHIATYASAATLYEVGFNHFFHAPTKEHGGDLLYIQGHSSPGIYARAFLEGRISEKQLANFRQEVKSDDGLPSYAHPWLMPDFWQFPTVSMGLGPIQAIYQARFLKYLHDRGLQDTSKRKVWCFLGDGETEEPETLGALQIAKRDKLDNLIFVVNCNLQRLDGPVRGNGKIIQDLEGAFRGSGWHVIKVIWGRRWDALFAKDQNGTLLRRMEECVDGDYQAYKANDGAFVREHFFGRYPELKAMVEHMSDAEIWRLNRGGHDPQKVYAAYHEAVNHTGSPTVVITKTVKGYGMGAAGEGQNVTHQQKKMTEEQLRVFRDRFNIPITDEEIPNLPFYRPAEDSPEIKYLKQQREALGGYLPARLVKETQPLKIPSLENFDVVLKGSGDREISTTMAFVRLLNILMKDKQFGQRVVPIVPDECRTFGMEGMFRQYGIYSPVGQLYTPVDADQLMFYKEAKNGQLLEEGISEAGAFCSWLAAATSYSTNDLPMIPFFILYSMFGFQRFGDLTWAAGDMRARGFLLGGTAGRTTLAGEGLQHQDGNSQILASTNPNCVTYDPCYAYELAVIMHDGLERMYANGENVFYYITVMNENYRQPEMPKGVEDGIKRGMYRLRDVKAKGKLHVQLLGSGTILREVEKAAEILSKDYQVNSTVWSVTSFNELRREGIDIERHNMLNPKSKAKTAYVTDCLAKQPGPVIAATDYVRQYAERIRPHIPQHYATLGTDGFGRSDTRKQLRHFFEVDAKYIVLASLKALADEGEIKPEEVAKAIKQLNIDPKKPNPTTV